MKKAAAGFFCFLLITGVMALLGLTAIDAGVLERLMTAYAEPVGLGRIGPSLAQAASDLSKGLFSGVFPVGVIDGPLFTDRELTHLLDCAGLVRGLLFYGIAAAAAGAAGCVFALIRSRQHLRPGLFTASAVLFGLLFLAGVWAAVDFDGMFITFHRVFFTNDLWLLDPGKHLLIQLMPTAFFFAYAGVILLRILPVPAALAVYDIIVMIRRRHGDGLL